MKKKVTISCMRTISGGEPETPHTFDKDDSKDLGRGQRNNLARLEFCTVSKSNMGSSESHGKTSSSDQITPRWYN